MVKTESQERFELFLSYLEGKSPLSPELSSRLEIGPFLSRKRKIGFDGEIIDQYDSTDRQLCLTVMKSGIFRQGKLKASVKPGKVLPIENLEAFTGELALVIKRATTINKESLLSMPNWIQDYIRVECFEQLDNTLQTLMMINQWNLANRNKVDSVINEITQIKEGLRKDAKLSGKMLSNINKRAKGQKDPAINLIDVFRKYAPDLNKEALSQRIHELCNAIEPLEKKPSIAAITKRLQRRKN